MRCDCDPKKEWYGCRPETTENATVGDLTAGAIERHLDTGCCPYCGHEGFNQDEYEFNDDNAWIRYSCEWCKCDWSLSYAFQLEASKECDHYDTNKQNEDYVQR